MKTSIKITIGVSIALLLGGIAFLGFKKGWFSKKETKTKDQKKEVNNNITASETQFEYFSDLMSKFSQKEKLAGFSPKELISYKNNFMKLSYSEATNVISLLNKRLKVTLTTEENSKILSLLEKIIGRKIG